MAAGQEDAASATDRTVAWSLVAIQFVLLGLIVLLPTGHSWRLAPVLVRTLDILVIAGIALMAVAATGLGRGLTAAPLPNQHARLRTIGAYRYVRHPIYSGLMVLAVARAVATGNPWVAVACALLILLLNVKARWEEQHLVRRFPGYVEYTRNTNRFIPRLLRR